MTKKNKRNSSDNRRFDKVVGNTIIPDGGQLFCVACGNQIDPGIIKCPMCGTRQVSESDEDSDQNKLFLSEITSEEEVADSSNSTQTRDGGTTTAEVRNGTPENQYKRKNPILAGLLSLLVTGAGQVYNGQIARGLGFFAGIILAWVITAATLGIGLILVLGVWVYAIYDAYTHAKQIDS